MNNKLYFKSEDGKLIEFNSEIVCTFETEDNKKYMVYTDSEKDDNGKIFVYGVTIDSGNVLTPINNEEFYLIEDSIETLKTQMNYSVGSDNDG